MKQAYCVQWKTASMPTSAFFYYGEQKHAQQAYDLFVADGTAAKAPRPCEVHDNVRLLGAPLRLQETP